MSKFGELINKDKPVVLYFFTEWSSECENITIRSRDMAAVFGDKVDVIKIDVDKNFDLSEALRIKGLPTVMVYHNGSQIWRKEGNIDDEGLRELIKSKLTYYG